MALAPTPVEAARIRALPSQMDTVRPTDRVAALRRTLVERADNLLHSERGAALAPDARGALQSVLAGRFTVEKSRSRILVSNAVQIVIDKRIWWAWFDRRGTSMQIWPGGSNRLADAVLPTLDGNRWPPFSAAMRDLERQRVREQASAIFYECPVLDQPDDANSLVLARITMEDGTAVELVSAWVGNHGQACFSNRAPEGQTNRLFSIRFSEIGRYAPPQLVVGMMVAIAATQHGWPTSTLVRIDTCLARQFDRDPSFGFALAESYAEYFGHRFPDHPELAGEGNEDDIYIGGRLIYVLAMAATEPALLLDHRFAEVGFVDGRLCGPANDVQEFVGAVANQAIRRLQAG